MANETPWTVSVQKVGDPGVVTFTAEPSFVWEELGILLVDDRVHRCTLERKLEKKRPTHQVDDNGEPVPPPQPSPSAAFNPWAYALGWLP